MTYRVYLRWSDGSVTDKTVTEDRALAELAFRYLAAREDLNGKPVGAAFTERSAGQVQQIAFHDFSAASPGADPAPADGASGKRPKITIKGRGSTKPQT